MVSVFLKENLDVSKKSGWQQRIHRQRPVTIPRRWAVPNELLLGPILWKIRQIDTDEKKPDLWVSNFISRKFRKNFEMMSFGISKTHFVKCFPLKKLFRENNLLAPKWIRWKFNSNETKEFILFLKIHSEVFLSSQSNDLYDQNFRFNIK